ncbi:hypothetical protein [Paraburkholderia adhaesiva]|uniref:hypothetical protein n=1 Tax=Paraburkholderia adhaesiva TaxID=2883244 RepID=UPI001F362231|nr:hypothetical protein [Paraburkholderia adhaesiva]
MPTGSPCELAIAGIDPGSVHLGTTILRLNLATLAITGTSARTLEAPREGAGLWTTQLFGERIARIASLEDALLAFFREADPCMIACEAPFINLRRPQAHGVLTEVICGIRRAVMRYDTWKPLYLIDPARVKNAVGAKGNADKAAIKAAVLHLRDLHYDGEIPLTLLDEHSLDAIAVAYAHRKAWMESLCLAN